MSPSNESERFRKAMRSVPTGVTIVTSVKDGEPRGMTVSAFAPVSADPPLVLICVNREARSYLYISHSGIFCVNVLDKSQRELAERFAGKVREHQFDGIAYETGVTGAPLLPGSLAHFECTVDTEHHAGSHSIFVGRVVDCAAHGGSPLGYFDGAFRDFGL